MSEDRAVTSAYIPEVFEDLKTKRPVTILLPQPDEVPAEPFLDHQNRIRECVGAFVESLHFVVTGVPGSGKNALIHKVVSTCWESRLYTMQGHGEQEPTDLGCRQRLSADPDGRLVASHLVAAMHHGGVFLYDEISKAPRRCLALLASILDGRRRIDSDDAAIRLRAHPRFRVCATVNPEDPPLPAFMKSRLNVVISVGLPSAAQLDQIVRAHIRSGTGSDMLLEAFRDWVADKTRITPRAAIGIVRYAEGLMAVDGCVRPTLGKAADYIEEASERIEGGLNHV